MADQTQQVSHPDPSAKALTPAELAARAAPVTPALIQQITHHEAIKHRRQRRKRIIIGLSVTAFLLIAAGIVTALVFLPRNPGHPLEAQEVRNMVTQLNDMDVFEKRYPHADGSVTIENRPRPPEAWRKQVRQLFSAEIAHLSSDDPNHRDPLVHEMPADTRKDYNATLKEYLTPIDYRRLQEIRTACGLENLADK